MIRRFLTVISTCLISGCSTLGSGLPPIPPEYNQPVQLIVDGDYDMFQAPRSRYDLGDLASFHSQHTLPIKVEGAFKDIFGKVDILEKGEPALSIQGEDTTPVFEVRVMDLTHDLFQEELQYYRGSITFAAVMKSPSGVTVWQQAFRGDGFINVNTEQGISLGPEEAVAAAVDDAIYKMQDAIVQSPQIRLYFRHYAEIQEERKRQESIA